MARTKPKLHWLSPGSKETDGRINAHCASIVSVQNATYDADEVNAADNGCRKCKVTNGYPDLPRLAPWGERMKAAGSEVRDLAYATEDATLIAIFEKYDLGL